MKWHWIQRKRSDRLLLFFNGWGMDQHPVKHLLAPTDWDVLMVYDYRDMLCDDMCQTCRIYKEIEVIGWSMGVWAFGQIQEYVGERVSRIIAINGTAQPIHPEFGIAPDIYQATLDCFDERGREKFFRRMCGSQAILRKFQDHAPQRPISEQAEELQAIQQAALHGADADLRVDVALMSGQDMIIPAAHQARYWQGRARNALMIDAPHYPFFLWKSWSELLSY